MIFKEELLIVISPWPGRAGECCDPGPDVTRTPDLRGVMTPVSWPSARPEPTARVQSIKPFLRCDQNTV